AQALVAAGLGVTILPGLAINAARHPGIRTQPLPGAWRQVFAVTYGQPPDPRAVDHLLDILTLAPPATPPAAATPPPAGPPPPRRPTGPRDSGGRPPPPPASDGAARALPVRVAQAALEQLPAGVARHLADEVDRSRPFHPGQPALQVRQDARRQLRPGLGPPGGLDHRLDRLTPVVVGDAEHRHIAHHRVHDDRRLDLGRVDVRPARDDHVALPVAQEQEAVGVQVADVADGEVPTQPVRLGLGRVALVHEVRQRHPHVHGAGHPGRALVAVVVGDHDLAD